MSEMVRKASNEEIINHWIMAVSCILLIITGYGFLFQLQAIGTVFGGFNAMIALIVAIACFVNPAFSCSSPS